MEHITYDFDGKGERWFDRYNREECIREFFPIAKSIFRHKTNWLHLNTLTKFPFVNSEWDLVMLVGDVGDEPIEEDENETGVSGEMDSEENVDGVIYDRDELGPLWEILAEDGVEEVILCDATSRSDVSGKALEIGAAIFPPIRKFVETPYENTGYVSLLPHYLFDRTRRWGIVGMMEDECLLGGEPEFMKRFIEKAGGITELQRRFYRNVMYVYEQEPYDLSHWKSVYRIVGWPFPFDDVPYPKGKKDGSWQKFVDSQD